MKERLIFHLDINSAFVSWEAAKRVALGEADIRLVPSVVGGDPKSRVSIVAARSIPAKAYGIQTGEPVSMALKKCPGLIVAEADFDLYVRSSRAFKDICAQYAPVMESFSIDEVFMDMSGMELLWPDPVRLAETIKNRIRDELGFTANVGIGRNKLCAKMASDFEKPDRVHTLYPEEIESKMWPLKVEELFGCGKSSAARLRSVGIFTIGDLACADIGLLRSILGEKGSKTLHDFANGIDDSEVCARIDEAKSYSVENTTEDDLTDIEDIEHILLWEADVVSARIRANGVKCSCIGVKYRTADWSNKSHQCKLESPTDVTGLIYERACRLMRENWKGQPIRLIGLTLSEIDDGAVEQLSLFENEKTEKLKKLDRAMDSIRSRYGDDSVVRASATADRRSHRGAPHRH